MIGLGSRPRSSTLPQRRAFSLLPDRCHLHLGPAGILPLYTLNCNIKWYFAFHHPKWTLSTESADAEVGQNRACVCDLYKAYNPVTTCGKLSAKMAGTSLVVQWLRNCFAMQRKQVPSLVRELRSHMLQSNKAHEPQLESLCTTVKGPAQHKRVPACYN